MRNRALRRGYDHQTARVDGVGPHDGAGRCMRHIIYADQIFMGNVWHIPTREHLCDNILGKVTDLPAWGIGSWPCVRQSPQVTQQVLHLCAWGIVPWHLVSDSSAQPLEFQV